jgi:hypothetical protein
MAVSFLSVRFIPFFQIELLNLGLIAAHRSRQADGQHLQRRNHVITSGTFKHHRKFRRD